ncbi:MAG: peptidoglycan-binding domain-containing protein [Pseudomonadota bacterium]
MRFTNNKTFTAIILLSATVTLFACKPIIEPKHKQDKDAAAEPAKAADATPTPTTNTIDDIKNVPILPGSGTVDSAINDAEMMVEEAAENVAAATQLTKDTSNTNAADDDDDVVLSSPKLMRQVQQALADRGFNPGPIDGKGGARTKAALSNFQDQHDIPPGKLTKRTLRLLGVNF